MSLDKVNRAADSLRSFEARGRFALLLPLQMAEADEEQAGIYLSFGKEQKRDSLLRKLQRQGDRAQPPGGSTAQPAPKRQRGRGGPPRVGAGAGAGSGDDSDDSMAGYDPNDDPIEC